MNFAEEEDYQKALEFFQEAINVAPQRSSIWNNRAQTHRLLENDEGNQLHLLFILSKTQTKYKKETFCFVS